MELIKIKLIIGDMYIAAVCTHGIASREGDDRPSTCSIASHFKLADSYLSASVYPRHCICVCVCVCGGGGGGEVIIIGNLCSAFANSKHFRT